MAEDLDVVIIGAGISGINTAQRIQTQLPGLSYAILDARASMGGTWDLFRYPGIRSDSDLYTFGFPWDPWDAPNSIADGPSIVRYMEKAAAKYGIQNKIRYHHKVISADWSSSQQRWILTMDDSKVASVAKQIKGRFLVIGTGYYDYNEPLQTVIPGIETFRGTRVHPQFWPQDLEFSNKRVAVIGSGATAVTLIPALAETASRVTMIQRSPGYIMPMPREDRFANLVRRIFPGWIAHRLVRWKFMLLSFLLFHWCRAYPQAARRLIAKVAVKELPASIPLSPHFTPAYNPWEQRLCACPDGDFFKALRDGKAAVVTGHIKTVTPNAVVMEDGTEVEADILVTATGLKMQMFGGIALSVDGQPLGDLAKKVVWRGQMLQDLPNLCMVFGYTNASWTLGAETSAQFVCRLLKFMRRRGFSSAVPTVPEKDLSMKRSPMMNLNSTYILKARDSLPSAGNKAPWLPKVNYFRDLFNALWAPLDGLVFTKNPL